MSTHVKVDVGTPTGDIKDWSTAEVRFHDFTNLTTTSGECVPSPEFTCLGHQWVLKLYPGGRHDADEGYVSVSIKFTNSTCKDIEIEYGFSVKDAAGKEVEHRSPKTKMFPALRAETTIGQGIKKFAKRSRITDKLVEGALIIDVRMRLFGVATTETLPFIPNNPAYKLLLSMFNDEETADTLFEVTDQPVRHDEGIRKRSKTTTTLHAHRAIVQKSSATLGELCKPGEDSVTTVQINDIRPDIFRHLLHYVYGGKVPDEELKKNAKDIVEAADKYGIVGLKLETEAAYVNFTTLTFDNAIENLLYADGKNCALLKETVMDFIAEHANEAVERLSFDDVPGSAMKDLLVAMGRGKGGSPASSTNANGFSKMRVNALRKMLHEKGLDVDGSREMMIARLEGESS